MPTLALIGFPLTHSLSKKYFEEKFTQLGLPDWQYELWPVQDTKQLLDMLQQRNELAGFNVTIPYKVNMVSLCNELSEEAEAIGAVNCVSVKRINNQIALKGYNTDAFGFEKSLLNWYQQSVKKALVYGDGGAAKAVLYVLKKLAIDYVQVVRNKHSENQLNTNEVNADLFAKHDLIINCTPVGTYPQIDEKLIIESEWILPSHQFYDLVYNPAETATMALFKASGASVKNGLEMLHLQADKAWEIWLDS